MSKILQNQKRPVRILTALLGIILLLAVIWGLKEETLALLIKQPETCALCNQAPCTVPCLLDISSGEVGKLAGTALPGKFQFIGVPGAWGGWDSDTQTGQLTLPQKELRFLVPLFCRECRLDILGKLTANYYLADLSSPSVPVLIPMEAGSQTLLGWDIRAEEIYQGLSLTISPRP